MAEKKAGDAAKDVANVAKNPLGAVKGIFNLNKKFATVAGAGGIFFTSLLLGFMGQADAALPTGTPAEKAWLGVQLFYGGALNIVANGIVPGAGVLVGTAWQGISTAVPFMFNSASGAVGATTNAVTAAAAAPAI